MAYSGNEHSIITSAKAGMEGVDKEKVKKVVYEMSQGSAYFANQQRRDAAIKRKIETLSAKAALITPNELENFQKIAEDRCREIELETDVDQIWVHVDMDAFYAAVEAITNPSLAEKPIGVGGMSMLCTANYVARKFGVRAAMPGFIAKKLCPDIIFIKPDFQKYTHFSELSRNVFREYDPNFIPTSLDEAYLDITALCKENGRSPGQLAEEVRLKVKLATGLTCSAGVAPNRMLAKICSDMRKPNGQFLLYPASRSEVRRFMETLPIRKVGGIGPVTDRVLKECFDITSCGQLLEKKAYLQALFSNCSSGFFFSVALGLHSSETVAGPEQDAESRKSFSCERTFSPTTDKNFLIRKLGELSDSLTSDLDESEVKAGTVTLKIKCSNFEVRTRSVSCQPFVGSSDRDTILQMAVKLLTSQLPLSIRLLGLRVSRLSWPSQHMMSMLPNGQMTLEQFRQVKGGEGSQAMKGRIDQELLESSNKDLQEIGPVKTGEECETSCDHREEMKEERRVYSQIVDQINVNNWNDEGHRSAHFPDTCNETDVSIDPMGDQNSSIDDFRGMRSGKRIAPSSAIEGGAPVVDWDIVMAGTQAQWSCSLCGAVISHGREDQCTEHEDYHLAAWLQAQERQSEMRNVGLTEQQKPTTVRLHKKSPVTSKKQKTTIERYFVHDRNGSRLS